MPEQYPIDPATSEPVTPPPAQHRKSRRWLWWLATVVVFILGVVTGGFGGIAGGSSEAPVGVTSQAGATSVPEPTAVPAPMSVPAPTAGCSATETKQLYVREMYTCASRATEVYLFNTSTARDSWRQIAEEFGTIVVREGATWVEVKA